MPINQSKKHRKWNFYRPTWWNSHYVLWLEVGGRPRPIVNPRVPSGIFGPGGGFESSMWWAEVVVPWPRKRAKDYQAKILNMKSTIVIRSVSTHSIDALVLLSSSSSLISTSMSMFVFGLMISLLKLEKLIYCYHNKHFLAISSHRNFHVLGLCGRRKLTNKIIKCLSNDHMQSNH